MRTKWLTNYVRNIPKRQRDEFRRNLAQIQHIFEYENSHHKEDGAMNCIWKKYYDEFLKYLMDVFIKGGNFYTYIALIYCKKKLGP
jgi:hypothetical protein